MWLDKEQMFSEKQDLVQALGVTDDSTNILYLGDAKKGEGKPIEVLLQVVEDFVSAGAATLQVKMLTDIDSAFGTAKTVFDSGALDKGILVAGYQLPIRVLPNDCEEYLKITYKNAVAATTAGKITAGLVLSLQTN